MTWKRKTVYTLIKVIPLLLIPLEHLLLLLLPLIIAFFLLPLWPLIAILTIYHAVKAQLPQYAIIIALLTTIYIYILNRIKHQEKCKTWAEFYKKLLHELGEDTYQLLTLHKEVATYLETKLLRT